MFLLNPFRFLGISSPLAIGDVISWYDFSDSSTVTLSGSDITQITDKSGNGYTMAQSTVAERPTINTASTLDFAQFDPTTDDQHLENSNTASLAFGTGNFAIVAIARTSKTGTGNTPVFSFGDANERAGLFIGESTEGEFNCNVGEGGSNFINLTVTDQDYADGEWRVLMGIRAGNVWTAFATDDETGHLETKTSGNGSESWVISPSVGASIGAFDNSQGPFFDSFDGDIGECIIFDKALTAEQRALVHDYLYQKWRNV